jgi:predicted dehydrogenase
LEEAETLARLASQARVLAVTGLQARSAPAVAYVRDLVAQGYVGDVLSTTLVGSGIGWGPTVEPYSAYLETKTTARRSSRSRSATRRTRYATASGRSVNSRRR